jgi:Skp family chaperone for outer membrane proteins
MRERRGWFKATGLLGVGILVGWAVPGQEASGAKEKKKIPPPRVGYFNVAKVLRDAQWANQEGAKITRRREEFKGKVGEKREAAAKLRKDLEATSAADTRQALKGKIETLEAEIQRIDAEAQKELTDASNAVITRVYDQFKTVAQEVAEEHGLDVIQAFPAASRPEDEKHPQVAQLMLQTPALIPFYLRPEWDVTQDVIDRLNKKYPKDD